MTPTDEEVMQRGRDAEAILANDTFMEAAQRLSLRITQEWRNAPTTNPDHLVRLHAQVAAIDAVMVLLKKDAEDAKYLASRIEKKRAG